MRPSCPEVGRSQRPDLVAKQRGTAAAVKQRQPRYEQPKRSTHSLQPPALLDDDDGRATPRPRSPHPRKQQKRPISRTSRACLWAWERCLDAPQPWLS